MANPFANDANMVDNSSWSYFHGLELEIARRFTSGLFFQGNYTFSKVLTDQRFLTSQNEAQAFRSLRDRRLDKNRSPYDVLHSFSANFLYPLPFGRGEWLGANVNPFVDKFIGGWNVQGLTRVSSGSPFNILSNRQNTGSLVNATAMLRNMTADELKEHIGAFKTPNGIFWLNPSSGLVTTSGRTSRAVLCTPGQTTPCFDHPGANQDGNLPFFGFDAPGFVNQDFSIIKRTTVPSVSETFNFEIRMELFNAFNHANFRTLSNIIDSANFGQLTEIVDRCAAAASTRA